MGSYTTAAEVVERYGGGAAPNEDGVGEPRTFGHVLVDEAQDLTAMQWRMLGRRCPSGSMTLVGDFGQSSRPGALHDWDAVRAQLPGDEPARVVTLSVNYRTPAEIMALADRFVAAAAPGVSPARSVRSTGRPPQFLAADDAAELLTVVADAAQNGKGEGGTTAVIAPRDLHDDLVALLADLGAVGGSADAIDAPVAVVDASDAKGLEFDHVVVVEPARLVTPDASGLRLLYTALTRATQTLTVGARGAAPGGPPARHRPHRLDRARNEATSRSTLMATTTDTDLTAADVAWDLEPLVDGKGEAGVDELLDDADRVRGLGGGAAGDRRPARRRRARLGHARAGVDRGARRTGGVVRGPAVLGGHHRPGARGVAPARRGTRHRRQHEDPLLRARVGGAARRPGGRAPRRRAADVLPPLPRGGAPLPAPPPHRARRARARPRRRSRGAARGAGCSAS